MAQHQTGDQPSEHGDQDHSEAEIEQLRQTDAQVAAQVAEELEKTDDTDGAGADEAGPRGGVRD